MNHDEFLQLVYDRFRSTNTWPLVRELQVSLRPLNVRLLAAQIGTDLVACEDGADGRCFLRLEGLARCPKAREDIETLLATIRFISKEFIEHGTAPVTSEALAASLSLSPDAVRRLGAILYRDSVCTSGGSWQLDGSTFSLNPSGDAVFFENVNTLDAFFEMRRRVAEESIAAVSHLHRHRTEPAAPTEVGERPSDPGLEHMRVFISWSGKRSHRLALLLHEWLPLVIQAVEPYVSSENIRKGTRWLIDIGKELEEATFGVLCIVPENIDEPWVNFEAGALSKLFERSRVVPLLFGIEMSSLVGHPLGQFQAATFEKTEVFKTLQSMNELLGSAKLPEERLRRAFEHLWPKLAADVAAVRPTEDAAEPVSTSPQPPSELDETEQRVLAAWAKRSPDLKLQASHIAGVLNVTEQRAKFYLDQLVKKKYLHDLHAMGLPTKYMIIDKGLEFLVRANLV